MDYTQSITDIYSDSFEPNSKKIILKIQKIQPKNYCISSIDISIDESKTLYPNIILINSNIECEIENQYIYNNFIYFVNIRQKLIRQKLIKYLSYDYDYNYDKNNDYIELYKINIINKKYNIYKFDDKDKISEIRKFLKKNKFIKSFNIHFSYEDEDGEIQEYDI